MPTRFDTRDCPKCGDKDYRVIDSRLLEVGRVKLTRRRRACEGCGYRESTVEIPLWLANEIDLNDLFEELGE